MAYGIEFIQERDRQTSSWMKMDGTGHTASQTRRPRLETSPRWEDGGRMDPL